ncbi:MAG: NAD(P)-dependent oxidoreductase [Desulfobacterales bacterium]
MKALVTGGAGTMGKSLVNYLVNNSVDVRVLDIAPEKVREIKTPALEIIKGSITDQDTVSKALAGVDVVYHLAESFSNDPYMCLETDIRGNINLLTSAVEAGIKHFLFMSTHRVYGRPRQLPIDEDHIFHPEESGRPLYGAVKVANEKFCLAWHKQHDLPVSIFRPWWSFYPAIRGKIVRNMIDTALNQEVIYVPDYAGGQFIHNDDAALCLGMAALNEKTFGESFNLISGVFITWVELAEMVIERCGKGRITCISTDQMQKDPLGGSDKSIYYECRLNGEKARKVIGFQSQFSSEALKMQLKESIGRLVEMRRS